MNIRSTTIESPSNTLDPFGMLVPKWLLEASEEARMGGRVEVARMEMIEVRAPIKAAANPAGIQVEDGAIDADNRISRIGSSARAGFSFL